MPHAVPSVLIGIFLTVLSNYPFAEIALAAEHYAGRSGFSEPIKKLLERFLHRLQAPGHKELRKPGERINALLGKGPAGLPVCSAGLSQRT